MIVLLDTSVLGKLCALEPDRDADIWCAGAMQRGRQFRLPEICDYELRRELKREGLDRSLQALDQLAKMVPYVQLTTEIMRVAADLWAQMRNQHTPTASDDALDGDCILAAQATLLSRGTAQDVVVATTNVKHLSLMVDARPWKEIA